MRVVILIFLVFLKLFDGYKIKHLVDHLQQQQQQQTRHELFLRRLYFQKFGTKPITTPPKIRTKQAIIVTEHPHLHTSQPLTLSNKPALGVSSDYFNPSFNDPNYYFDLIPDQRLVLKNNHPFRRTKFVRPSQNGKSRQQLKKKLLSNQTNNKLEIPKNIHIFQYRQSNQTNNKLEIPKNIHIFQYRQESKPISNLVSSLPLDLDQNAEQDDNDNLLLNDQDYDDNEQLPNGQDYDDNEQLPNGQDYDDNEWRLRLAEVPEKPARKGKKQKKKKNKKKLTWKKTTKRPETKENTDIEPLIGLEYFDYVFGEKKKSNPYTGY